MKRNGKVTGHIKLTYKKKIEEFKIYVSAYNII